MPKFIPYIHHRHSIRQKGYDYSKEGIYFITFCVHDRKCLFGKIKNDQIILNDYGIVANENWIKLPERFPNLTLDVFQIMPNHIHGIIHVGATLAVAPLAVAPLAVAPLAVAPLAVAPLAVAPLAVAPLAVALGQSPPGTIAPGAIGAGASPAPTKTKTVGDIIGAYKSLVANDCLKIFKQKYTDEKMGKIWQRNFYDHIIRDEHSYQRIREYIMNNPKNWNDDKLFNHDILNHD